MNWKYFGVIWYFFCTIVYFRLFDGCIFKWKGIESLRITGQPSKEDYANKFRKWKISELMLLFARLPTMPSNFWECMINMPWR